jgi:hypothetical protein
MLTSSPAALLPIKAAVDVSTSRALSTARLVRLESLQVLVPRLSQLVHSHISQSVKDHQALHSDERVAQSSSHSFLTPPTSSALVQ